MEMILSWFNPTHSLTFYMKSGNSFTVDHITEYEINSGVNGVNKLKLVTKRKPRLMVTTIDLTQIEAIILNR